MCILYRHDERRMALERYLELMHPQKGPTDPNRPQEALASKRKIHEGDDESLADRPRRVYKNA